MDSAIDWKEKQLTKRVKFQSELTELKARDTSCPRGKKVELKIIRTTGIEISCISRNLIIVIFYYQISLKPLKTLSLSQESFPLCYIFPYEFTISDNGKNKGKKII